MSSNDSQIGENSTLRHTGPRISIWRIALAVGGLGAIAAITITYRYSVIDKPWGYVRFDRWTGKAQGCAADGCKDYGDNRKLEPSTRNITVELANGQTHIYKSVPDSVTREQLQERARRDFGSEILELCCLASKSGMTDAQIADALAKKVDFKVKEARKAGYSDREIIEHIVLKK